MVNAEALLSNIKNGTELGTKAKAYMDQGLLVPDELTLELIMDRFREPDCKNGYVLDGFPRTIPQAEALTRALEEQGESIDYAANVEVPDGPQHNNLHHVPPIYSRCATALCAPFTITFDSLRGSFHTG